MTRKSHLIGALVATLVAGAALPALATQPTNANVQVAAAPAKPGKPGKHEGHPAMMAAKKHLQAAAASLQKAEHDFKGHRAKALELVNQAIKEIDEGIAADKQ